MTNTNKLTAETITADQIEALEVEATRAGDLAMASICQDALYYLHDSRVGMVEGKSRAVSECVRVINDARAQAD